jgi:hypothetical protein
MSISIALVPLAAYLTFTNLHAVHDYYQIAVFPAVVMAVAIAITELTARLPSIRPGWLLPLVLTFVVVFFAWIGSYGLAVAETIGRPMPEPELSHVIDRFVPTGSGVIVVGCDWDPQVLYGADRRGLALPGVASHVPIPIEWIPSELSYLAFCNDLMQPTDGDPASILPPSIIAERLDRGIYRLSR